MSENKIVFTICCMNCHLWGSCETKWYRGEKGEGQVCCPICKQFFQCNPNFPRSESRDFSIKLIEVVNDSVSKKQFVTAHHFALFLPIKDFSTLKDLKDKYIDNFGNTKDMRILNEGLLIFSNLLNHVENKTAVLVNLAYFGEYLNPDDADQLILKALEGNPPLEYIIKFYRWLRDKQKKADYIRRLSNVSQYLAKIL